MPKKLMEIGKNKLQLMLYNSKLHLLSQSENICSKSCQSSMYGKLEKK